MEETDLAGPSSGRRLVRKRTTTKQPPRAYVTRLSSKRRQQTNQTEPIQSLNAEQTANTTAADPEVVSEDDICPVCQVLLLRPVVTSCNHVLCEVCMATWAEVSVTNTAMQIVDVDDMETSFNAVTGLEAKCPMCRTQTSATLNTQRANELKDRYPKTYAERESEDQENVDDGNTGQVQTLTLNIGNRHNNIASTSSARAWAGHSNTHDWTFFVRPSRTDIIEEVHIHLHPTFRQSKIVRTRPPYEVSRLGWGYFTIVANIILKPGYSWVSGEAEDSPDGAEKGLLPLRWTLDFSGFNGRGSMGRLRLKVRNQRHWDQVEDEEEQDERGWQRTVRQYNMDPTYVPDEEM